MDGFNVGVDVGFVVGAAVGDSNCDPMKLKIVNCQEFIYPELLAES